MQTSKGERSVYSQRQRARESKWWFKCSALSGSPLKDYAGAPTCGCEALCIAWKMWLVEQVAPGRSAGREPGPR